MVISHVLTVLCFRLRVYFHVFLLIVTAFRCKNLVQSTRTGTSFSPRDYFLLERSRFPDFLCTTNRCLLVGITLLSNNAVLLRFLARLCILCHFCGSRQLLLISRRLGKIVLLKCNNCFGDYNRESTMIGVAPYDKNHTENIDSCKIGISRCFFVLNMSGYITNCRIEFYSIFLFCRVENGDRFQQRRLQNRIVWVLVSGHLNPPLAPASRLPPTRTPHFDSKFHFYGKYRILINLGYRVYPLNIHTLTLYRILLYNKPFYHLWIRMCVKLLSEWQTV